MADENFDSLRELLAAKRQDLPSDAYFNGVLGEFHRRQRAEMLRATAVKSKWERLAELWEECLDFVRGETAPVLRYGLAGACGVVIAVAVWQVNGRDISAGGLAQSAPATPAVDYAFGQGLQSQPVASSDKGSLEFAASEAAPAHYVLSSTAGTDSALAF